MIPWMAAIFFPPLCIQEIVILDPSRDPRICTCLDTTLPIKLMAPPGKLLSSLDHSSQMQQLSKGCIIFLEQPQTKWKWTLSHLVVDWNIHLTYVWFGFIWNWNNVTPLKAINSAGFVPNYRCITAQIILCIPSNSCLMSGLGPIGFASVPFDCSLQRKASSFLLLANQL